MGSISITGLASGETLVGIDYRPADGKLYGVGSNGNLYTLEPSTGAATLKVALRALAGDDNPFTTLNGTSFAVDFNPAADRLRVVGNTGQNLRINVDTGDTTTDGAINPATNVISAAGYTNSFAGTSSTQLFVLDAAGGRLLLQDPPNNGTLTDIGPLGVDIGTAAFDIGGGANGLALAALRAGASGPFTLYNVSLTTGAASPYSTTPGVAAIGGAGGPANLVDIAIRF